MGLLQGSASHSGRRGGPAAGRKQVLARQEIIVFVGVAKEPLVRVGSLTMQANETEEMEAACHCGTVRFQVKLTDGFNTARRCTCSYCRMRGAVAVSANVGGITFDAGEDALTVYRFNTGTAQHYFCSRCGIYTHHRRRSNPNEYGINAACLEGISPFDFAEVTVVDGVNHPSDRGADVGANSDIVGYLRFDKA